MSPGRRNHEGEPFHPQSLERGGVHQGIKRKALKIRIFQSSEVVQTLAGAILVEIDDMWRTQTK